MTMKAFRKKRDMPFVKRGMIVESLYLRKLGKVMSSNGDKLKVRIAGQKRGQWLHPKWKMRYFDANGNIIEEHND